jgi:subtilisin family serine protease
VVDNHLGEGYFMKVIVRLMIMSFLLAALVPPAALASAGSSVADGGRSLAISPTNKIDARLQLNLGQMQAADMTTVIITLVDQANLRPHIRPRMSPRDKERVVRAFRNHAENSQRNLRGLLRARQAQGSVRDFHPLWVINGLSVTATEEVIRELAGLPQVASITPDEVDIVPAAPLAYAPAQANLNKVNAPALWDLGFFGQGVVVASMDTGVDISHPDLSATWRGGANSWFDPYGQHPETPTDGIGHGTWTMGVMVGRDAGGTSIGVAPQAQWIAVKMFNDRGSATATAIHQGFQWLLDPDGDPTTADQPQVVNNSWAYGAPGCNLEFQADLQALRAVGILPVFSAGNYGPNGSTSVSPANYPEAFAVGATNNFDGSYGYSSRGPTTCGQAEAIYPKLSAPGVSIRTTDLYGMYISATGTSIAAPHVSGSLALLLSAFPTMSSVELETALTSSAVDLGNVGPDNVYGYGRLDIQAAYYWLLNNGNPSSTATATPVSTETVPPTVSPTPTETLLPPSPTPTATLPPSPTPTATLPPSPTPTATLPPSPTPTATLPPSPTPTATLPPSPTPTATLPPSPTPTATLPPSPTPTATQGDSIFLDGFEQGSLSAWNASVTGGGRLSASTAASLVGDWGMQALINSGSAIYVADRTPSAETSYRARFYFSPNGVTIPSRKQHDLFLGINASNTNLFRVQIRYSNGYQVRSMARDNQGREHVTNWYPIGASGQVIEIQWQAATSSDGNNGLLSLWLNGVLVETRGAIPNGTLRLEEVRLGPQYIGSGISGTEYFDAFVSTRSTYIGP